MGDEVRDVIDSVTAPGFYASIYDFAAEWIQTTAPISHGNSGGPLTDSAGKVVGMNTWSASFVNAGAQNLNFAISADEIRDVLEQAKVAAVITHLSKLPPPRDFAMAPNRPNAKPNEAVDAGKGPRAQAELLRRIYEQRAILISRWELARTKAQSIDLNYTNAGASLLRIENEGATLRQGCVSLQQQAEAMRARLQFERDPGVRAQLQGMLNNAIQTISACQLRYAALDAEAARQRVYGSRLEAERDAMQRDVLELREQADSLRSQWLAAIDAYGKLARGEDETAVAAFSEWIVLEADNPQPYFMRGLVHLNTGRKSLADADFNQAMRLDRSGTMAKMIRDVLNLQQPQAPKRRR
jgi:hypothetical protein